MASKKQTIIHNTAMIDAEPPVLLGHDSRLIDDRSYITKDADSSSLQELVASIQLSQQQEDLTLSDILWGERENEGTKEQSNCEWEQMTLNRENIFREIKKLKLLSQQLQAQVTAL